LEFHLVEHHLNNIPLTTQSQTASGQRLLGIHEQIDNLNRNFHELSIEQKELKEIMKKLERLSGNDQKIVNMLVDKLNEKESAVLSKATYVF
jgi:predicted  nucleic acid-binding Zn-ribbon protein